MTQGHFARLAWPADSTAIAEIQRDHWHRRYDANDIAQSGSRDFEAFAQRWALTIERPQNAHFRVLVATSDDVVVGFGVVYPSQDPDSDPDSDSEIGEFVVASAYRRVGHGSRLLNACADTMRADGYSRAVCWLDVGDDPARSFLVGSGWSPDGAHREFAGTEESRLRQIRMQTNLI